MRSSTTLSSTELRQTALASLDDSFEISPTTSASPSGCAVGMGAVREEAMDASREALGKGWRPRREKTPGEPVHLECLPSRLSGERCFYSYFTAS